MSGFLKMDRGDINQFYLRPLSTFALDKCLTNSLTFRIISNSKY